MQPINIVYKIQIYSLFNNNCKCEFKTIYCIQWWPFNGVLTFLCSFNGKLTFKIQRFKILSISKSATVNKPDKDILVEETTF
jgi:hypothetical protein